MVFLYYRIKKRAILRVEYALFNRLSIPHSHDFLRAIILRVKAAAPRTSATILDVNAAIFNG